MTLGYYPVRPRGCSLKNSSYRPQKNPKIPENPKKIQKIQEFFWGFKIRIPNLGIKISLNSVFKYFLFIKSW